MMLIPQMETSGAETGYWRFGEVTGITQNKEEFSSAPFWPRSPEPWYLLCTQRLIIWNCIGSVQIIIFSEVFTLTTSRADFIIPTEPLSADLVAFFRLHYRENPIVRITMRNHVFMKILLIQQMSVHPPFNMQRGSSTLFDTMNSIKAVCRKPFISNVEGSNAIFS